MSDNFWEKVNKCDYCGCKEYTHYLTTDKPNWFKNEPLKMYSCNECGLVAANPRPVRETIYVDYLEGGENATNAVVRKINRPNVMGVHNRAIEHAMKFCDAPSRLFDMGCGAGTVMEAALKQGLTAEGNDINKAAIDRLTELGFKAYLGFTNQLDLPQSSFDIVINFDYLEHSYEPYQDLVTCNKILKDGGILYLKTLYLDCPDHILKDDGYQLFGAGHFSYFPARTLCSMVYSAGFEIVELKLANLVFITARKVRAPNKVDKHRYSGTQKNIITEANNKLAEIDMH